MRTRLKHERLAEAIARSRRSQNGWAIHLELSPAYLSRLANGKRPYPNPETREKLLAAFEMKFEELFEIEYRAKSDPPLYAEVHDSVWQIDSRSQQKGLQMLDLGKDIRLAVRLLLRKPVFTALVVFTLALGIGANVAVYSVVDHAYFQPLPFPDDERLAVLWNLHGIGQTALWPLQFRTFEETGISRQMGAFALRNYQLLTGGEPLRVPAAEVTPDLLPMLSHAPLLGRYLSEDEFITGQHQAVVISHNFFLNRFGGEENLVGREIQFGRGMYELASVLPPEFDFPWKTDLFFPLTIPKWQLEEGEWGQEYLRVVARLEDSVSLETARARLNEVFEQRAPKRVARGQRIAIITLREHLVGDSKPALAALFAASILVFLIACTNVANLFLVRAETRKDEFSIRMAIGAGRLRIFRQLLSESTLLSVLGCGAGFLIAVFLLLFVNSMPLEELAPLQGASLNWQVLWFGLGLLALTCLIFGLLPTIQVSARSLGGALAVAFSRSSTGWHLRRVRVGLVIAEMGIAIALAVAVLILLQSFYSLRAVDPGFQTEGILSARIELPANRYTPRQRADFFNQLGKNLAAHREVEDVAFAYALPMSGRVWSASFAIVGRSSGPDESRTGANIRPVSPNFFRLMGIPLEEGRLFDETDRPGSPPVVVIDRALAVQYWSEGDAIGQLIEDTVFGQDRARVIGIVGTVKDMGLELEANGHLYSPLQQFSGERMRSALIKTAAGLGNLSPLLRREVQRLDATLPVFDIHTLKQQIDESIASRRLGLMLIGIFGAVALLLAAVGVYGLTAYSVRKRTSELGIRMALGARSAELIQMVLREVLRLWMAGVAAGLILAYAFAGLLGRFVFNISSTDPASFLGVALLLGLLSLVVAAVPARLAGRLSCVVALRHE